MKKQKILAVITARGGSKEIPRKNIKKLGGRPLISYTIESAKKSDLITNLIVSTDDKEIADVSKKYGADVPFMRPKELSQDNTPHLPVIQHAVSFMEDKLGITFDYVVILQPTSPFRTEEDIDGTIQKLIDTNADSAVSICQWKGTHPISAKKLEGDKVLPYFVEETTTRRQDLQKVYQRSSAVYVIKHDKIMEKNQKVGENIVRGNIVGYTVPKERSIDIDGPLDFIKAEYMLRELKKKNEI
jgi:N-acylneuraminate cytidylyltransferase/CMP-N,N'-diacetyllegionaminic acid synthase|tara:strand:+ start:11953 stop:12681 length:729 start_codon:yes stop_codon:yes gene_type:complete